MPILGGGIVKQRVARPGKGKSGGYRTLILFRRGDRAIFAFGFAKSAQATSIATAVGPICRLCERVGCLSRAEPPITRPLGLDEMVTGLSAFDFQ